ncbi:conserved hypothetical protein [Ignisphaera aggregans DSM 17230]|uniref:Uncharacterized protein n=1 Tax=Ignisphaera aggregans (strain DSM 17230 / JCM 13409 / AQ1.S1) TaxID=583356 RepID=E0SR31_IGNAA|nr:conserved hypothetical protein [Ignisphaera aggregans DSM 17230]
MDEVMIAILGLYVTIVAQIAVIAYWLGRKFTRIEERFKEIDRRFSDVDKRFEDLEQSLRNEIRRAFAAVLTASMAMNSLIVDFLALKGLVTEKERDFLKSQLTSIVSSTVINPLTKEEIEFLRKVFSKPESEITIEELDKVLEIAKRWFFETGEEKAYKLWLYTYMYRASLKYERLREKEERQK